MQCYTPGDQISNSMSLYDCYGESYDENKLKITAFHTNLSH